MIGSSLTDRAPVGITLLRFADRLVGIVRFADWWYILYDSLIGGWEDGTYAIYCWEMGNREVNAIRWLGGRNNASR